MLFFNLILKESLSPNQFYLLNCIEHGLSPASVNIHQDLRVLVSDGWLKPIEGGYTLQAKSTDMIGAIGSYFKFQKKRTAKVLLGNDFTTNIVSYRDLFPKGKLPSGKPARSNDKTIEANFRWFFENYTYTWDTILKATAHYIDEYEKKNYLYMRTAQYFICKANQDKSRDSELADYCSMIESGDFESTDNHFKENVV